MKKKIAVVIVTFNGEIWIKKNLNSLLKSNYPIDIIIVDNASTDQSINIIKEFGSIELIENNNNLGFGKANTIGIDLALKKGADAIFLLNQDTWIFENTISNLAEVLFENPNLGIVSPLHFSAEESILDENFNTYYNRFNKEEDSESLRIVPFVNAAAWLVSKECFSKTGYFDPIFNHYGEDRNYCERVKYHGFKIGVAKKAAICHDRIVKLNSNKIELQSKYLVLNEMINCNDSLFISLLLGLKSVVGLPKFHSSSQSVLKTISLFFKLLLYYFNLLLNIRMIIQIRKNSINGTNGVLHH
ncbi:MAG: glycosyltransferase family 2 protein [Flavobacterium sp.]|nr:glycosyltransferase family 2 protein [Flavobacterium sp.]